MADYSRTSQWSLYIVLTLIIQITIAATAQIFFSFNPYQLLFSDPRKCQDNDRFNTASRQPSEGDFRTKSHFIYLDDGQDNHRQHHDNLESAQWAPLALTKCKPGMPKFWAPCVQAMNPQHVIYAEELIFPDFVIRYPKFCNSTSPGSSSEEQLAFFLRELRRREDIIQRNAAIYDDAMVYRGQHAQNVVLPNVSYYLDPHPNGWMPRGCMNKEVGFDRLAKSMNKKGVDKTFKNTISVPGSVVLILTPEHSKFQHFLDRASHLLEQSAHLYDAKTKAFLLDPINLRLVDSMYNYYGLDPKKSLLRNPRGVSADRMIFACRALLLHPWHALRFQERFGINRSVPASARKYVLFFSRAKLRRPLLNETELMSAIEKFLEVRNQGEMLIMFSDIQARYRGLAELMHWINYNVIAIVGAHGGSFYNHRFAAQNTLLVEIMPKTRIFTGFFEESHFLRQHYFMLLTRSKEYQDFTILTEEDISAVISAFQWFFESIDKNVSQLENHAPVVGLYDWPSNSVGYRIERFPEYEVDPLELERRKKEAHAYAEKLLRKQNEEQRKEIMKHRHLYMGLSNGTTKDVLRRSTT